MTQQKIYEACLAAIRAIGVSEFKKATWFGWKKPQQTQLKKAA